MGPSNRSYALLALIVVIVIFGARKCSYDIKGDLMREWLIAECNGKKDCRHRTQERFAGCFDDEYGIGVFVALSRFTSSNISRNSFNARMRSAVSKCILAP